MKDQPFLDKAEEAATAAEALLDKNLFDSAAARAYYAAFHAARAALIDAGLSARDRAWTHEAIPGAFSQLTHRRKMYPAELLKDLSLLRDTRLLADYESDRVSSKQARTVVARARNFVNSVATEIKR